MMQMITSYTYPVSSYKQLGCKVINEEFTDFLNNQYYLIYFKRPVRVVVCKTTDGMYEASLSDNENLQGYGETQAEAKSNLVNDIIGAWLLTEFEDEELQEGAKKLRDYLKETIKEVKEF